MPDGHFPMHLGLCSIDRRRSASRDGIPGRSSANSVGERRPPPPHRPTSRRRRTGRVCERLTIARVLGVLIREMQNRITTEGHVALPGEPVRRCRKGRISRLPRWPLACSTYPPVRGSQAHGAFCPPRLDASVCRTGRAPLGTEMRNSVGRTLLPIRGGGSPPL